MFSFPDPVVADPEFQFKKLSLVLQCTICLYQYLTKKYPVVQSLLIPHLAGRPLTSDWFINSFIMAVYQKFVSKFGQDFLSKGDIHYLQTSQKRLLFPQGAM